MKDPATLLKQIQDALVLAFYDPDPADPEPVNYEQADWVGVIADARQQLDRYKFMAFGEHPKLYDAARKACHDSGMPWTYLPPAAGSVPESEQQINVPMMRQATEKEQRDAILKWAQESHRAGSSHDCGEWLAGHRCQVCGSWVDED